MTYPNAWIVHKFGGSCLANSRLYEKVACRLIALGCTENIAVVVSAQGCDPSIKPVVDKVTSLLFECTRLACKHENGYTEVVHELLQRHTVVASQVLEKYPKVLEEYVKNLETDFDDLKVLLKAVWINHTFNNPWWTGYGEIWSARLLTALLHCKSVNAAFLDARDVLFVDAGGMDAAKSKQHFDAFMNKTSASVIVITGYIASTTENIPTTLGRDGSDYSAALFASLLNAKALTIWTDVDGIFSANPNWVPSALVQSKVSYHEAMEMSYFGAKVLHPKTMGPVIKKSIPVYVKNLMSDKSEGTCVSQDGGLETFIVKGISCIPSLSLINVEGTGMIGVPGVARRIFQAVEKCKCSVVMITQGGSEHSITFAVPSDCTEKATFALSDEFHRELQAGDIQTIDAIRDCACLGIIGDNMVHTIGIAAKIFSALSSAGVNIRAIAQGSSERNISAVIDEKDSKAAVQVVHNAIMPVENPKDNKDEATL